MNIIKVKTSIKVGNFELSSGDNLKLVYEKDISKELKTSPDPRVYIFTINGEIAKIGGSIDRGGIKRTMSLYENAMKGSPGPSRFVLNQLITEQLKNGNKVEVYMITSPKVIAKVSGLFTIKDTNIAAFKEMEDLCKNDYYNEETRFPIWNFQENKKDYPSNFYQNYLNYHQNRIGNKK